MPRPITAAMAMARIKAGSEKNTSTTRIRASSARPPANPASIPYRDPIVAPTRTTATAIPKELRVP